MTTGNIIDRQHRLDQIQQLKDRGRSIRAIASELGMHRSSVHRALKSLDRLASVSSVPLVSRLSDDPFVGRRREMGVLGSALDAALSGRGQIAILAGDPGIGKTRTAQEFSNIANARNAQVFWGHCYEGEGAPPYWPWLQVIRSCIDQSDAEHLEEAMGSGAEAIGEIVP